MKLKPYLLGIVVMLGFISSCNLAYAQEEPASPVSLTARYGFDRKEWSLIGAYTFDPLWTDLGGKKGFNIELYGLAGGNANSGVLGGGLRLVYPVHPRVSLTLGLDLAKRAETFSEFFSDAKGFEFGGSVGVLYQMRF